MFSSVLWQVPELPLVAVDCSSTGAGLLVTKPINLKIMKGEQKSIRAKFDVPVSYTDIILHYYFYSVVIISKIHG